MNQQKSLSRISELLARFKFQTIIQNSNAQLDINIVAEDVLIPILNIAYDCNLVNAKYSEQDARFPALDLLDRTNRIAFQITSTATIKKVRETLEKIVKNNFNNDFDTFYVYILTEKKDNYAKTVIAKATQNLFNFTEKNVLDESDLYQKVASLRLDKILEVEALLEKQFADISKVESAINLQVSQIVTNLNNKYENHFLATELQGAFEARQKWLEKRLFFEKKLSTISDINQEFTVYAQMKEVNDKIEFYNKQIFNQLSQISE